VLYWHTALAPIGCLEQPPGHELDDSSGVAAVSHVQGEAVSAPETALDAAMDHHQPLARSLVDGLRPHQTRAARGAIAGCQVDVLGPQARRAVVSVIPVAQRRYLRTAVLTRKTLILGGPADGSASGLKK
jgi:hypothetical protein